jgi:hypothetical protein
MNPKNVKKVEEELKVEAAKEDKEDIVKGHAIVPLNLREKASFDSKIVTVLMPGVEILVNKSIPNEKFYKVSATIDDVTMQGFCSKEFISLDGKPDVGKSD